MTTGRRSYDISLAGECMVMRPFSAHDDPGFTAVLDLLRGSDLTYAHLETNLGEYDEIGWPAKAGEIGSYLLSDPRIAADLRWAGVDVMSLANNHSMDFGAPGMLSTIRHIRDAGIAHAGTGRDLEEAREPAYLETRKGRVALISVSSGNKPHENAGLPKGTIRGRPGVNPLRVRTRFLVDQPAAKALQDIAGRLGILQMNGIRKEGSTKRGLRDGEFTLALPEAQSTVASTVFAESDAFAIETTCDERDLAGNLRVVEEAVAMADLVMVAHHFNVAEGSRGDGPPAFARQFAHACIDAGADVYIAHGWHKTLGIEIYQGRPAFYGMGNFFAQSEFIRRVAYDSYEAWGHDVDRLGTLTPAAHPLHPGLDAGGRTWWSSAVVRLTLTDGRVEALRLHPVGLGREVTPEAPIVRPTGRGPHTLTEGRPVTASPEDGLRILQRIKDLSAGYGTDIEIDEPAGVGVLKL
ncbi:CapA family protein [Actinomadura sp. 9N215]|uniref:CapA family protein n=1 Tax=Actinomadura sp. 9N215 TaxID=3375150 RepID=UPI00379EE159